MCTYTIYTNVGIHSKIFCVMHRFIGQSIGRAAAEQRMLEKLQRSLTEDIAPLLPAGITFTEDDAIVAFSKGWVELISRIAGKPWKLSQGVIDEKF